MTDDSEELSHAPKTWQAWSRRRNDWAIRAYDRFMESLSEEIRDRFAKGDENGEAYVVVFGNTQVGKTTLLLDLMGVTEQAFARVTEVLRGGREPGKSATATAMEYGQSRNECWLLNDGDGMVSFDNDDAMEQKLAELRVQMSRRAIRAAKPVVVGIPRSCFFNGVSGAPRVRMLDLPGANAAEAAEREHVDAMARRYVPHADLILLVGRGDDLSFLHPDALAVPGIEDWQIVPARFRIVTTYSFTPDSLRMVTRNQMQSGSLDVTFFRQRLLDQIGTFEKKMSKDSRRLDLYFPLEIGKSWLDAKQSGDELVEQVGPIIADLKNQLRTDISRSASKMARLKNAYDVYSVVGRYKTVRLSEIGEVLAQLEKNREPLVNNWQYAKEVFCQARSEFQEKRKYLLSLSMSQILADVERMKTIDIEEKLARVDRLNTDVGAFRRLIADFTSELTRGFLASRPPTADSKESRRFWLPVDAHLENRRTEVISCIAKEFAGLHRHLDSYWIDEYFPDLSNDFSNDKNRLRRDLRDSARNVGELAFGVWHEFAIKRKAALDADLVDGRAAVKTLMLALKRQKAELHERDVEIARKKIEIEEFEKRMNIDMENGRKFQLFMDEEYLAELKARHVSRQKDKNATASFLSLLAGYELIDVRKNLQNRHS